MINSAVDGRTLLINMDWKMLSFAVMGNKFLSYLFIIFQKQEELRK